MEGEGEKGGRRESGLPLQKKGRDRETERERWDSGRGRLGVGGAHLLKGQGTQGQARPADYNSMYS